jgi:hypothetical protein
LQCSFESRSQLSDCAAARSSTARLQRIVAVVRTTLELVNERTHFDNNSRLWSTTIRGNDGAARRALLTIWTIIKSACAQMLASRAFAEEPTDRRALARAAPPNGTWIGRSEQHDS